MAGPGPAQPAAGPAAAASRLRRRVLTGVILAGVTVLLFLAYLGQARSLAIDSDSGSVALQAWQALHGNPLLRGWWTADVTFYTTEMPEYMIMELIHGLHSTTVQAASAVTYTLLVALSAVLARGRVPGREGLIRALVAAGILLAPGLAPTGYTVLNAPDHIGTMVPLLAIWLAIEWLPDRRWLPLLVGAGLAWVTIADEFALLVATVPVIVVCAIRLYQRRPTWRTDAGLLAAAVVSYPVALGVLRVIRDAGGFVELPNPAVFTTAAQLPLNLSNTVGGVVAIYGADFFGLSPDRSAAVALIHLVGLGLAVWAFCIAARRLLRDDDRVTPILVLGIVVNLALYGLSTDSSTLAATREVAAVLPYGAVLAGRVLPGLPPVRKLFPALLVVLVGYAAILGYYATRPPTPPAVSQVDSWLVAHHLDSGIGDYWAANVTTVNTGGTVVVRSVTIGCDGRFAPYLWEVQKQEYLPPQKATFMVFEPVAQSDNPGEPAAAVKQFGKPAQTVTLGQYEVMVWNHNLLPSVSTRPPGCGPQWPR